MLFEFIECIGTVQSQKDPIENFEHAQCIP